MTTDLPANLIPGAEPTFYEGGPIGALVLHGFTGNPGSMRQLAERLAAAGVAVPCHGADSLAAAWAAARAAAAPGDRVLVFGSFHTVAALLPAAGEAQDPLL